MSPAHAPRLLAAATAGLLSVVALGAAGPAQGSPPPPRPGAVVTTFADEFDGPAGSAVDPAKWQVETGDNVNNHERQYYTAGNANAATDGVGHLVITAKKENPGNYACWYGKCEYTSARLNTAGRFSQAYGHFEARILVPRGQGMWPAFWMLGNDFGTVGWPASGEIDIMENVGFEPGTIHSTIHGPGYSGGAGALGATYTLSGGRAFADAYHTFALDWAPNSLSWSVDGKVFHRRTPADLAGKDWVFNKPFYLILNLAVGGYWPGDPDASTVFPQRLVVDYVRVTTGDEPATVEVVTDPLGRCRYEVGAPGSATVRLRECDPGAHRKWTVGSGGVMAARGRCLLMSTLPGVRERLWACVDPTTGAWTATTERDVVNPNPNRCPTGEVSPTAQGCQARIRSAPPSR